MKETMLTYLVAIGIPAVVFGGMLYFLNQVFSGVTAAMLGS